MLLQGKNIIVTGSNRGMGKAMVELFTQQGANVWACARKPSEEFEQNCQKLAAQYNVEVTPVYFDLTKNDEIKAAFQTIRKTQKPVDGLVSNAGILLSALFHMMTWEMLHNVFQVNFFGPMLFEQCQNLFQFPYLQYLHAMFQMHHMHVFHRQSRLYHHQATLFLGCAMGLFLN